MEEPKKINRIWKTQDGNLRAIWKLGLLMTIIGVVANPLVLLLDATDIPVLESSLRNLCVAVSVLVAIFLIARIDGTGTLAFGISFEIKQFRQSALRFAAGLGVGGALMFLIVILGWVSGQYSFEFQPSTVFECSVTIALLGQMLRYAAGSFFEETVARGIFFNVGHQILARKSVVKRNLFALVTSSLIFGGLHFANPESTTLGIVNLFLVGLLFGLLYLSSGDLWLPIGAHMSWNVVQNNLFGLANSGQATKATIFVTEVDGASHISGGSFGPEGGLIATIVLATAILAIGPYAIRQNTCATGRLRFEANSFSRKKKLCQDL